MTPEDYERHHQALTDYVERDIFDENPAAATFAMVVAGLCAWGVIAAAIFPGLVLDWHPITLWWGLAVIAAAFVGLWVGLRNTGWGA